MSKLEKMTDKEKGRRVTLKVHVTPEEKVALQLKAITVGLSLSKYLSTVGLARQTSLAAERNRDHVSLLEMVLSRLNSIADYTVDGSADSLIVLEQLCLLERHIIMLAPFASAVEKPEC